MKKLFFLLSCLAFALSCSNASDTYPNLEKPSLDNPETMAYLHNAALNRYVSSQTKSGEAAITDVDNLIPYVCNIVLEEAAHIGINASISNEDLNYIESMSADQIAHFSLTNEELVQYYINLFPFSNDIKERILE